MTGGERGMADEWRDHVNGDAMDGDAMGGYGPTPERRRRRLRRSRALPEDRSGLDAGPTPEEVASGPAIGSSAADGFTTGSATTSEPAAGSVTSNDPTTRPIVRSAAKDSAAGDNATTGSDALASGRPRHRPFDRTTNRATRREPGHAREAPDPADAGQEPDSGPRPSPAHLAELSGSFAMTANISDPEPAGDLGTDLRFEEQPSERGLRGLIGGGSSQVSVAAAMRARDSSRPTDEHVAAAERSLPIVRRGWVPREELPRPGSNRH